MPLPHRATTIVPTPNSGAINQTGHPASASSRVRPEQVWSSSEGEHHDPTRTISDEHALALAASPATRSLFAIRP
jgi:hypothetical protein